MENIDDIQLSLTKFRADSTKYFSLFDKHIPRFENDGAGRKFLMLGLSNEGMMLKCCSLNKNAEYFVADQAILSETLPLLGPEYDFSFFDTNLDLYDIIKECDMKFDCIIMNPPYNRGLHLKILDEAIKHLKDEKSNVVNLSPVRWLQDPLAKYKKNSDLKRFEESVAKHIESLDIIDKGISGDAFNIGINSDLGIYKCNSKGGWNYESICWNYNNTNFSFFEKLISISKTVGSLKNIASTDISKGIAVPFNIFGGGSGGRTFNGEYVSKILATNEEKNNFLYGRKKQDGWNSKRFFIGAVFNTLVEAQNFKNFITSALMRCFGIVTIKNMHIDNSWAFVPNLYNAINPRTGKKGYTGEWTDDDLYKFFNITPAEQKIIEETMEKYK